MAAFVNIPGGVGRSTKLVRAINYPGVVKGKVFLLYERLAEAGIRQGTLEAVTENGVERALSKRVVETAMAIAKPVVKFFRPSR